MSYLPTCRLRSRVNALPALSALFSLLSATWFLPCKLVVNVPHPRVPDESRALVADRRGGSLADQGASDGEGIRGAAGPRHPRRVGRSRAERSGVHLSAGQRAPRHP